MIPFDASYRKLAHEIVDRLFDHAHSVDTRPVVEWRSPADLGRAAALTDQPSPEQFIRKLDEMLAFSNQLHHRSYAGHQVCPPAAPAVLGDLIISFLNQSAAVWEMSPYATMIEKEMIRWMADRVPYPSTAAGTSVSGGSAANLTALLAARARWRAKKVGGSPVIICSSDAHYSIARAASIMGLSSADLITVPTDAHHRLDPMRLAEQLETLRIEGRSFMAIVATSGSTATGAFDDLISIAALRDQYETWLHVDAAHGASVLLSSDLMHLVRGLDLTDSLSWDPHKMMWMPLSLGVVLVRDGAFLRAAFEADAPYLFHASAENIDLGAMTMQCSRRTDMVKLWLTLQAVGEAPFADALERVTRTTRELHALVNDSADFEAMHEPELNIFCFRFRPGGVPEADLDEMNGRMREELIRSGRAWITTTVLDRRRVLRITLMNPRTESGEMVRLLDDLREIGHRLRAAG